MSHATLIFFNIVTAFSRVTPYPLHAERKFESWLLWGLGSTLDWGDSYGMSIAVLPSIFVLFDGILSGRTHSLFICPCGQSHSFKSDHNGSAIFNIDVFFNMPCSFLRHVTAVLMHITRLIHVGFLFGNVLQRFGDSSSC